MARNFTSNQYIQNGAVTILRIQFKDQFIDTLIDTDIVPIVSQYHWRVSVKKNKMYIVSGQAREGTLLYLHTVCSRSPISIKGYEFDHFNGNSLDNRHCNLRLVTRQENLDNMHAKITSKSGIRGVSYDATHDTYTVDFSHAKKRYFVKPFKTIEEATYARYCFEKSINSVVIEHNPVALEYIAKLSDEQKSEIEQYILNKISGN